MEIRGYLKTSLIEWPGKISTVLFVPGCNFRCPFCYNRDLVLNPAKLPEFKPKDVLADLLKRKKWLEAVVISGGEPTLQKDLAKFLTKLKKLGFLTMVETNGSRPLVLKKLFKKHLLDRIAMDIKEPLAEGYLKKSVNLIRDSGIDFEFRTTVVPGIHNQEVLMEMVKQLREQVGNCKWFLQTFQAKNCLDPKFTKIMPYNERQMKKFLKAVKKIVPLAQVR